MGAWNGHHHDVQCTENERTGVTVRILLLSNLYPPTIQGGAEILAADIAAGLRQRGHEVLVLTSSLGSAAAPQDGQIWRTLYCAPPAHFDGQRALWHQLKLPYHYYRRYNCPANAAEVRRVVRETQPDVLYVWELAGTGVTSTLHVLAEGAVPLVFHLNSYWLLYACSPETQQSRMHTRWLKQLLIGRIPLMRSASFIAISEAVRQHYIQGGYDPTHIAVIPNGIDQIFFKRPLIRNTTSAQEPLQLLFVGRLRVEKGLLVLLKALDLLLCGYGRREKDDFPVHLHVFGAGDDVYVKELDSFLQEKQLRHAVSFHGKVLQSELLERYDRADILLVPSLWDEPFGLVVAEAMACGLPVIASNCGGPAELITHNVNGLLVPPGDVYALTAAIRDMVDHPLQRHHLGQAARETAQTRFTLEENVKQVEQHLLRVMDSGQGASAGEDR
jgi:glycosyltransferase involved in cell wall biosynthesis